jgi:hypothetical protein
MSKEAGPLTVERLKELADAPMGRATKALREHDPMWNRQPGDKIRWKVTFREWVLMEGYKYVEAETEEEAQKLADEIKEDQIDCDEFIKATDFEQFKLEPC